MHGHKWQDRGETLVCAYTIEIFCRHMKVYRSLIQCYLTTTWPFCVLLPNSLQPNDRACRTRGEARFEQCDSVELILGWSWLSLECFLGVFMRVVKWNGIPECVEIWICYPCLKWVVTHFRRWVVRTMGTGTLLGKSCRQKNEGRFREKKCTEIEKYL